MTKEKPRLVWLDEEHLKWKPFRFWHLNIWYCLFFIICVFYAYLYGEANSRTFYKEQYIYFPCAVQKWNKGGAPIFKELYKKFEETQFKEPVQLNIINK
jgi:hypothetical protein